MHTHKNKPEWEAEGSEPADSQVIACFFFIHAVRLNLLSPHGFKVCGKQKELLTVTAAQTAATLAVTLVWDTCQNSSGPIESMTRQSAAEVLNACVAMPMGGAPGEKKKWWLTKLPKIPLPPSYWFTGSGMLPPLPSSQTFIFLTSGRVRPWVNVCLRDFFIPPCGSQSSKQV